VWKADLRGQGEAVRLKGSRRFGLKDLALTDLDAILQAVRDRTRSRHHRVHVIGASLGGTFMMTHAVIRGADAYASMVTMGSPIRWVDIHPLVKVAFRSPAIAGAVSIRGTRRIAGALLPVLAEHAPSLLSMYLNPAITDTRQALEMAKTVEDPSRHLNREIAEWILQKDLVIDGINVAEGLRAIRAPFLCIAASADGVVPARTAEFPYHRVGSTQKALIQAGGADVKMAHADLFVSREAKARVFEPMSAWLRRHH
jgi:alpha-beta hydrolase superfamily lysophospholipase